MEWSVGKTHLSFESKILKFSLTGGYLSSNSLWIGKCKSCSAEGPSLVKTIKYKDGRSTIVVQRSFR